MKTIAVIKFLQNLIHVSISLTLNTSCFSKEKQQNHECNEIAEEEQCGQHLCFVLDSLKLTDRFKINNLDLLCLNTTLRIENNEQHDLVLVVFSEIQ